jgi:hypothetical protein
MNSIRRLAKIAAAWAALVLLVLSACGTLTATPDAPNYALSQRALLGTSNPVAAASSSPTRANIHNNQAAATAEVVHANARATLDSADATLGAAQTQDQSNANMIAAQIASTAEIERAHAQATLVAAGSTQDAALTQDAIRQTQAADQATTGAAAVVNQQNEAELASGTQTAIANGVATQAQAAVATSQWYADQVRQREEQRQVPIGFLWAWGLPIFIVLLAGLILWGLWRWLRLRQANQRILVGLVGQLQPPAPKAINPRHDDSVPYLEGDDLDSRYQITEPEDQVHRWLDEVKRKLRRGDQKDEEDDTDN